MSLEAIFAMSQNRVIGKDGKIPWYLPEDFKLFKEITLGHRVIMGRKTLESIKKRKALPNRENFVLTTAKELVLEPLPIFEIENLKMSLEAIFAMSQKRVIGKDGKIPWYLPEDFKLFSAVSILG